MSKLARVTINLSPRSRDALDRAAERMGENRTDVIQQSLLAYDWLTTHTAAGAKVVARQQDGTEEAVVFL